MSVIPVISEHISLTLVQNTPEVWNATLPSNDISATTLLFEDVSLSTLNTPQDTINSSHVHNTKK